MHEKFRSTSVWLSESTIAEIDALAAAIPQIPGARFSRNAWIASAIKTALDAAKTPPAAAGQTQNP